MERVTGKGVKGQQNLDNGRYSSVNARAQGLGSMNQSFFYDPSSSINTNIRPPDVGVQYITRPVQNFSIQTGEEFAFEFMRDRVNPRPQIIQTVSGSDHVGVTSYVDSNGMLVLTSSLPESASKVAMITPSGNSEIPCHDRNRFSANGPVPSLTQTSGGITSFNRVLHHEISDMSDTSSVSKLKFLCSFGGRILPRPSDGKLRYVGGETRVMRINQDVSWEELLQKAMTFYNETRAIKYQLPGEDLDALVSISCDEDLHHMVEECNLFEEGVLQKLRIFLLSALDLDNSEIGLGNMEADCVVQYVVAVNGMDFGSRRNSIVLGSTLGNLDELLSLGDDIASTSKSSQFVAGPSSLQLSSETNPLYGDIERYTDVKRTNPNDYEQISEKDAVEKDIKMNSENSSQKLNDFEKVQSPGTKKVTCSNPYDAHVSSSISKDKASAVNADSIGEVGVYPIDSSNEPPTFPQNMFRSERLPRELAGLNRLSKSDDSSGAQFLVAHAHSDGSQQNSEALHQVVESDETGLDFVQTRDGLRVSPQTREILPSGKTLQSNTAALPKEGSVINTGNSEIRDLPPKKETSGSSLRTPIDMIRENIQDESVSNVLRQVPLGGEVPVKQADVSTKKIHIQPTAGREYSMSGVSEKRSPSNVAVAEGQDILIDINDRFPPDFLSDIFSKAKVTDGSDRQSEDTGLSLNVENHEPKRWSYFQKLAQEEDFVRKDVSLMDLDHLGFSAHVINAEEATPLEYGLANSKEDRDATDQIDSAGDFTSTTQKKTPGFSGPNIVNISSDYNPQTTDTENVHFDDATTPSGKPDVDYEDEETEGETTVFPLIDLTMADFDPRSLQIIMNEDLEEFRELGSGTFGTVYYGQWRGTDVAIKRIKKICFTGRSSEQERLRVEFWREAEILSRLHHPNVVAFYGVVQDGPGGTLATVAEFMVNGSLRHVLLSKDRHLDRRKRLVIAMDAAFGMEYLHSKSIVHFDLKCDNLLVNLKDPSRPICKVADFGLSKIKRNTLVTGGVRGTLPWMAPELLNGGSSKVSEKVDVFSFGIVLWEILTGEEPYSNMHYGAIIGGIVNNTLRPQVPSNCDPDWKLLMEQCWAPDPSIRPSFTEIARRLRLMLSVSPSQGRPQGTTKLNQVVSK